MYVDLKTKFMHAFIIFLHCLYFKITMVEILFPVKNLFKKVLKNSDYVIYLIFSLMI